MNPYQMGDVAMKLNKLLKLSGGILDSVRATQFGSGEYGFSFSAGGTPPLVRVHIIQRRDGRWRIKCEASKALTEALKEVDIEIAGRAKPTRKAKVDRDGQSRTQEVRVIG